MFSSIDADDVYYKIYLNSLIVLDDDIERRYCSGKQLDVCGLTVNVKSVKYLNRLVCRVCLNKNNGVTVSQIFLLLY